MCIGVKNAGIRGFQAVVGGGSKALSTNVFRLVHACIGVWERGNMCECACQCVYARVCVKMCDGVGARAQGMICPGGEITVGTHVHTPGGAI